MAEFCRQCAEKYDIGGYSKAPKEGNAVIELCEGCGWTWVDHEGWCIDHEHHKSSDKCGGCGRPWAECTCPPLR